MILLVTGISTEPSLFHASCRPSLHVGLRTALTSDLLIKKARPTLTSDLLVRKALHSHLSWKELNPLTKIEWPALASDMEGT